jgi:hypothetical protein
MMQAGYSTMRAATGPSVWKVATIGGKEGLIHRLGNDHLDAIGELLEYARDRPLEELGPATLDSQPLRDLMACTRHAIMQGIGAIVLSGLQIEGLSVEDYERVYWFLGSHLGRFVPQSGRKELIGRVRHATDSKARGYLSNMELGPHTDYHDVLSLASYQKASSGGLSGFTSALAVHNEMLQQHPDLLQELYEGYYNGIPTRYGISDNPHSEIRVPAFSNTMGQVSAFTLSFWFDAARQRGEPIPDKLLRAMQVMQEIASQDDFQIRFMLEPGEMVFWNNRSVFHSRTYFENTPGHERMLLRLWIDINSDWPLHPEVSASAAMIERFHEEGRDQMESANSL